MKSAPIEDPPISSKALPITGLFMTVQGKGANCLPEVLQKLWHLSRRDKHSQANPVGGQLKFG
jgi:hypothetical protein